MANENHIAEGGKKVRLIDVNAEIRKIRDVLDDTNKNIVYQTAETIIAGLEKAPTIDAVEVVRCKDCRWSKPYERTDGNTGYCCHFCGHTFKYGTNWERLYTPIKEQDDFCSYGERKDHG